jgi:hypothetical protein
VLRLRRIRRPTLERLVAVVGTHWSILGSVHAAAKGADPDHTADWSRPRRLCQARAAHYRAEDGDP